jgi:hypothetical protein
MRMPVFSMGSFSSGVEIESRTFAPGFAEIRLRRRFAEDDSGRSAGSMALSEAAH